MPRAHSALRSTSTRRSPRSSRSCVDCSHSTARRSSSSSRQARGSWRPPVSAQTTSSRLGARSACRNRFCEEVIGEGRTIYREDIAEDRYPEEADLRALGVRSRVLAPLQLGARSIGVLAISRTEPASFRAEEIDLVTLLGRLVATAVQNLRTYEAERASADELRRLSSLRADFVSLVSHELRSPMAAVIGSARTLQHRWRELKPEQREAFLAVIGDETSRLSDLVGDVLDTSRIEAGTFGYAFSDVDLAGRHPRLGRDRRVRAGRRAAGDGLPATLPTVRGDAERLRQLVDNLISNAIKYSEAGGEVLVEAEAEDGHVTVRVRDHGPGILARASRPHLREVRPRRRQRQAGHGSRALPLALVRRGARRLARRRIAPGRGLDLHAHPADRLSPPSPGA